MKKYGMVLGIVMILTWCLLPVVWIISLSFKSQEAITNGSPGFFPSSGGGAGWQNYIDGRIDAGIDAALKARAWHDEAKTEAIGTALGTIRAQLRDEIAAAVGELRADFEIAQKANERREQDRGEIIDMPTIQMRGHRG